MRVNVEQPYTLAELKPKLEAAFPQYKISMRGPKVIVIGEGKVAGMLESLKDSQQWADKCFLPYRL